MVPSHRRALRARLLSFRYLLRISFSTRRLVVQGTKSWPGGPRPTLRRKYEMEPLWFLLIAGRFARGCSLSDIYYGLVSPRDENMRWNPYGSLSSPGASRAAALLPIFITD